MNIRVAMAGLLLAAAAATPLQAADGAWTGTGSQNMIYWDEANWLDGLIADGAGSSAYFTNDLPAKITLTNDVTLGYLQVNAPAAANTVTFEGGALTLSGGTLTIRTDNRRVDFRTVLRGSGGFTKTGNQAFYSYRRSEMSGPVKINGSLIGLDFRQDADSTNALALNHLQPDGLTIEGVGGQVRVGGRPSRTSDQSGVFTLQAGNRRVLRISGVSTGNLSAGQPVNAAEGLLPEGTFLKTILDDNNVELSAAPLADGNETLTFKASSFTSVQEFNTLTTSYSGSLYVGGDATTARIGELSGGYRFTGEGTATAEIRNTRTFGGVITLTNTLTLALTDQRPIPAAPATNAAFHVDASAASTLVTSQSGGNTMVGQWLDKNGTPTVPGGTTVRLAVSQGNRTGLLAPFLVTNALNGLPVVDFGPAGSSRGMIWNDNIGGIRTLFIVVGSQEGGGTLLGNKDNLTCSFERGMDVYASKGDWATRQYTTPLTKDHALFYNLVAPNSNRSWINGQEADHQYAGLSGGYDLVSFTWGQDGTGGSASAFAWRGISTTSYYAERTGGQRLAEVILYQRVLTDQERRDTEAYLSHKWFGKTLPGYGAPKLNTIQINNANTLRQEGANPIEIDALSLPENATLNIPSGTAVSANGAALAGRVALAGGTLRISARQTPAAPAPQPALHLDAATNVTRNGSEVSRWDDCSGGSRYAFSYSGFGPSVAENALNGLPVIDFGTIESKKFLAWDTNIVIRSLFLVMNLRSTYSAPIGTYLPMFGVKSHFTRLGTPFVWNPTGQANVRSGACYLDGLRINPGMYPMTHNSFVLLGQVLEASSIANAFACEAYLYTDPNNRANRTGGMQLAEVIIYDRKLTERESLDTQAYLNWKWFGRTSAGYASPGGTVNIGMASASAAATESLLSVEGDAPVAFTQLLGAGSLLLNAAAPVSVGSLDALTGGLKLTNTTVAFPQSGTLNPLSVFGVSGVSVGDGATVTAASLTGGGTLVKTGAGTLSVGGGSGFSGGLALLGGTLTLGTGVQLNALSLTGTDAAVTGSGTLSAQSISAGASEGDLGTLTVSNLALPPGCAVTVNISGETCDRIDVPGTLNASAGGSFHMTFTGTEDVKGQYTAFTFGDMDAASATAIASWTITGDIPPKYKRTVIVNDGKVMLSLSLSGTLLSVK